MIHLPQSVLKISLCVTMPFASNIKQDAIMSTRKTFYMNDAGSTFHTQSSLISCSILTGVWVILSTGINSSISFSMGSPIFKTHYSRVFSPMSPCGVSHLSMCRTSWLACISYITIISRGTLHKPHVCELKTVERQFEACWSHWKETFILL